MWEWEDVAAPGGANDLHLRQHIQTLHLVRCDAGEGMLIGSDLEPEDSLWKCLVNHKVAMP